MTERKRRPSGEGSARPKGLGWEIRFQRQVRRPKDDARLKGSNSAEQIARWKSSGAIPRPVRDALRDLVTDVERGTETNSKKLSFAAYVEDWLDHHASQVRRSTLTRDEQLLRLHVVPVIGRMPLRAIRPMHVQKVMDGVASKGRSPATQLLVYRVLSSSLAAAVRLRMIAVNHATAVKPPRVRRPPLHVPDRDQVMQILDVTRDSWIERPVQLAAASGMRLGEVLGLRWKDVDSDAGVLRVVQAIEWTGRDFSFTRPKNGRSRAVAIPPFAVDALKLWRKEQLEKRLIAGEAWEDNDLVISDALGRPFRTDSVSSKFRALMKREGIEPRPHFHALRHAYGSALLAANIHPKVAQEQLGHADVAFTLRVYSHTVPGMGRAAADAIQEALGNR